MTDSGIESRESQPRIAVVGSGLAGLAATWLLGPHARVTVYEAHETPGMGAHSVALTGHGAAPKIDVPLRVLTPAYYPTLVSLYEQAGVDIHSVDYAASFSKMGGASYFAYRNARLGGRSVPWISPALLLRSEMRAIARELMRLHRRGAIHLANGQLRGQTLGAYLESEHYHHAFVEGFLLPAYASICTCSTATVRAYPADIIIGYFCSGVTTQGVARAAGGTEDVIARLLAPAAEVRTGTRVKLIRRESDGVSVVDQGGEVRRFDHVVLAAQADQGAALVDGDNGLRRELLRVPHENSRVVVHTDPQLAPRDRRAWRPVNFLVSDSHAAPMATIWLNKVQESLRSSAPLFQSWNPLEEPGGDKLIAEAVVSRPVVSLDSQDVPRRLMALHKEPQRRIWPVGSYAEEGIPLLEAAAASAMRVATTVKARLS